MIQTPKLPVGVASAVGSSKPSASLYKTWYEVFLRTYLIAHQSCLLDLLIGLLDRRR